MNSSALRIGEVALLNEGQEVEEAVNRAGYLFFTDADAFHTYVLKEILANSALDSLFS
jgi:hypothetical protein